MTNLTASDVLRLFTPSGAIDNSDQILFYSVASNTPVKISAKLLRAYLNADMDITINNNGFLIINGKVTEWKVSQDIVGLDSRLKLLEDKVQNIERGTFGEGDMEFGVNVNKRLANDVNNLNSPYIELQVGDVLELSEEKTLAISYSWALGASVTEISTATYTASVRCFVATYKSEGTIDYVIKRVDSTSLANMRFEDTLVTSQLSIRQVNNGYPMPLYEGYPMDGTIIYISFVNAPTYLASLSVNGSVFIPVTFPDGVSSSDLLNATYYGLIFDSSDKKWHFMDTIRAVDSSIKEKINTLWSELHPFEITISGGGIFERGIEKKLTFTWTFRNGTPNSVSHKYLLTFQRSDGDMEMGRDWEYSSNYDGSFSYLTSDDVYKFVFYLRVDGEVKTATANFYYPIWTNEVDISLITKHTTIEESVIHLSFGAETATEKHKFHIPSEDTLKNIKILNTLSNKYEDYDMSNFEQLENTFHNSIAYKVYKRKDGTNGATKFQLELVRNG